MSIGHFAEVLDINHPNWTEHEYMIYTQTLVAI